MNKVMDGLLDEKTDGWIMKEWIDEWMDCGNTFD